MFHIVTGGSGSGKSSFAEDMICKYYREAKTNGLAGKLIYTATMIPYGDETVKKIRRHRRMREKKEFSTVECYTDLEKLTAAEPFRNSDGPPCVLLECISNLTANEMYEPDGAGKNAAEKVLQGIENLRKVCSHLVIVTNEVCSDSGNSPKEMELYKKTLAEVNRRMAGEADIVTEVVYGIPVSIKMKESSVMKKVKEKEPAGRETLRMVTGGAYQGKRQFAEKLYGNLQWEDGATCLGEAIYTCEGIYHFETYIRRMLEEGKELEGLAEGIAQKNPGLVIITDEIGYGLVPMDAFERKYRELTGRICTDLAAHSCRVDRVVCGVGMLLKGEKG